MMFLACPACLDQYGAQRCGLPAEVKARYTLDSSDGPIEAAMISCPAGHHFNGPIESLTWDGNHRHELGPVGLGSRGGGASLRRGHVGPDGGGESALQEFHAGTRRKARRPNGAPAYYIGRPATMWITALRPRRTPAASRSLTEAAVRGDDPALASGVPQDS
jgi:hypothetical protein